MAAQDEQTSPPTPSAVAVIAQDEVAAMEAGQSKLVKFYAHPWTQIILISMICFCCPGAYNALGGLGGKFFLYCSFSLLAIHLLDVLEHFQRCPHPSTNTNPAL